MVIPWSVWSELAGMVLLYDPCTSEVTLTVIVQEEAGAIVPLLKVMTLPPGSAVSEADVPQPESTGETGSARKTLAGRLSVRNALVSVVEGRLLRIVIVRRLVPPTQIVDGLKLLLTEGAIVPSTFRVALAGLVLLMFVPPPVEVRAPLGIVLIRLPRANEVTLTVTVQDPGVDPL